jgi:hypothetical protein
VSYITDMLLRRLSQHEPITPAEVPKRLGYEHRGEPLKSLRLDRPEKAIRPQETIEMWLERINGRSTA